MMRQVTLEIEEDYMQSFTVLLASLPVDKIHLSDPQEQEDEQFASLLKQHHKQDFVSPAEVFQALDDAA